jgi:ABC-type sugar transport system substrate-binding protein
MEGMLMKQRRLFAVLLLAAIAALAIAGPASAAKLGVGGADQGGRQLTTTLTGAQEVPVPGDPTGRASPPSRSTPAKGCSATS